MDCRLTSCGSRQFRKKSLTIQAQLTSPIISFTSRARMDAMGKMGLMVSQPMSCGRNMSLQVLRILTIPVLSGTNQRLQWQISTGFCQEMMAQTALSLTSRMATGG